MATFHVSCEHGTIGDSELENHDPSMGVALGKFRPSPAYEHVRSIFLLFAKAVSTVPEDETLAREYYRRRDDLNLVLRNERHESIETSAIHINDCAQDLGPDGYELVVYVKDAGTYARYFPGA